MDDMIYCMGELKEASRDCKKAFAAYRQTMEKADNAIDRMEKAINSVCAAKQEGGQDGQG